MHNYSERELAARRFKLRGIKLEPEPRKRGRPAVKDCAKSRPVAQHATLPSTEGLSADELRAMLGDRYERLGTGWAA